MKLPLRRLPATRLAKMIAEGEATSEVVTRSFIDAIHARGRQVRAFAWFDADRALGIARELDRLQANAARRTNCSISTLPSTRATSLLTTRPSSAQA